MAQSPVLSLSFYFLLSLGMTGGTDCMRARAYISFGAGASLILMKKGRRESKALSHRFIRRFGGKGVLKRQFLHAGVCLSVGVLAKSVIQAAPNAERRARLSV